MLKIITNRLKDTKENTFNIVCIAILLILIVVMVFAVLKSPIPVFTEQETAFICHEESI